MPHSSIIVVIQLLITIIDLVKTNKEYEDKETTGVKIRGR